MKRKTWYLCQPERNPNCGKANCFQRGGRCMMTSNRAAAVRTGGGKAVLVIIRKTRKGFRKTIAEEA